MNVLVLDQAPERRPLKLGADLSLQGGEARWGPDHAVRGGRQVDLDVGRRTEHRGRLGDYVPRFVVRANNEVRRGRACVRDAVLTALVRGALPDCGLGAELLVGRDHARQRDRAAILVNELAVDDAVARPARAPGSSPSAAARGSGLLYDNDIDRGEARPFAAPTPFDRSNRDLVELAGGVEAELKL